jgi:hypothetical protein
MRAIFGFCRHHVQDPAITRLFDFTRHPSIPSRPRITIMLPVIDAISFAGPSAMA